MTLSYANGPSTLPLRGETIGRGPARCVEAHGDRDALVSCHQGIRLTYARAGGAGRAGARGRCSRPACERGDRVGIWAPNSAEWVVVQFATARVGAILVNVNPSYRQHELEYALRQSGCSLLLLRAAASRTPTTGRWSQAADAPACASDRARRADWDALLAGGDGVARRRARGARGRARRSTSRSTSSTRRARRASRRARRCRTTTSSTTASSSARCSATRRADRVCVPVPFYHCFGMVLGNLGAVTHGACIVDPGARRSTRARRSRPSQAERCTSLYGVPTMFIAELGRPGASASFDLSCLRTGIMAGSPCPVEVMKRVASEMHMDEVTICYGMTETSPVSTQTRRDDPLEKRVGTVGAVHPHVEVKIVDPAPAASCRAATPGELCTRGYSVMLGYWDDEEATRAAIDARGWMHTGDLATMDDDGYVNIVGRIKDMIIRGGENIYPREIEEFLYTHPAIARRAGVRRARRALRRGARAPGWSLKRRRRRSTRTTCGRSATGRSRASRSRATSASSTLPADRHGQGPEVQDARARDRGARPEAVGGRRADGVTQTVRIRTSCTGARAHEPDVRMS